MQNAATFDFDIFGGTPRDRLRAALADARVSALRPPPRLHVDQWADRFRVLSPEASSTPGKWDTGRVEIARGVMRAVTEPGVRSISVMACTQLLKTEVLNNVLGYRMHLNPGPMLVIQPTEGMAEAWSKDRLAPMLRDTPALRDLVTRKGRDSDSTILHKVIPGGHVTMVGSNSPAELASRPIRDVYEDEGDKWAMSAGAEGDPGMLAEERTATFPSSRLVYRSCSPTIKGRSWIGRHIGNSDQRKHFVPCPHCGVQQVMRFGTPASPGGVKWGRGPDGEPKTEGAAYHCPHCGCAWSEAERLGALALGEWRQTRPFRCCGVDQDPVVAHEADPTRTDLWEASRDPDGNLFVWRACCTECRRWAVSNQDAGFLDASKLYSPWEPMPVLAAKFLTARKTPETLKVFMNTSLAVLWEEQGEQADGQSLLGRREAYPCGDRVPDEVVALFSSVDAQRNRAEVQTIGIGRDEQVWIVDYQIVPGDLADPSTLAELEKVIWRPRTRGDGRQFFPEAVAVDVGDGGAPAAAAALYRFCADHRARRCFAIRGAKDRDAVIWARKPSISRKHNAPVYWVGTQRTKSLLASRLALKRPEVDGMPGDAPPGYIHLSKDVCDPAYIEQLTVEKLVRREQAGASWYEWRCPEGARNEAWDTLGYCWAVYQAWIALGGRLAQRVVEMAFRTPAVSPSAQEPARAGPTPTAAGPTPAPESPTAPADARGEAPPPRILESGAPTRPVTVPRPKPSPARSWIQPRRSGRWL
ncbi:terminase gpA endonuclease subunit (plasmid) [Roseomonas mucosa]|uniref:phage terminase large subunit family protein n=1 Tax=Roseomonas mucosa TaxID=207340 RepID=UPI0030D18877